MLASVVGLSSCSDDEQLGTGSSGILSGANVPNAESTGHVQIRSSHSFTASGTLLDNNTVLTNGHVLSRRNCRRADNEPLKGNTWRTCRYVLDSHRVGLGNSATPGPISEPAQMREVSRISVHPEFIPHEIGAENTHLDVAVLRVSAPFSFNGTTSGFQRSVSSENDPQSLITTPLTCFGYGRHNVSVCGDQSGVGVLRSMTLPITSFNGEYWLMKPVLQTNAWQGDSGGPCIAQPSTVVEGVIVTGGCPTPAEPGYNTGVIPANAFRTWSNLVRESIADINERLNIPGIDTDDKPDAIFLFKGESFPALPGTWFALKALFSNGTFLEFPVFPDNGLGSTITSLALGSGSFGGATSASLVGQVNGKGFYFKPSSGQFDSVPGFNFLSGVEYARFSVADFDGDGFDDLEAETAGDTPLERVAHVYYGSASGLTAGRETFGFPTDSRYDGQFLLVTGTAQQTFPSPSAEFVIQSASTEPDLRVEVYDGRDGSGFDRYTVPPSPMCFRLYADPLENGSQLDSQHLVAQVSGSLLAEAEYSTIYAGPNHVKGKTPGGHFSYRLVVTSAACDGTPSHPLAANAFKVRSTGYVFAPQHFSFWGRDHEGPAVAGIVSSSPFQALYDTEYDGIWSHFGLEVGSTTSSVIFQDADADYLLDQSHPGQESIANDIDYVIRDFESGQSVCVNSDPSGNIEIEKFKCSFPAGKHQFLQWQWRKVLSTNMIHLWYAGSTLRMSTRPIKKLPVTSALPASSWSATPDSDLAALLPIVLGQTASSGPFPGCGLVVDTVKKAKQVLAKAHTGGQSMHPFRGEFLALELNVKRAAQLGEPLTQGYVYGTNTVISDLLADAHAALASNCHGKKKGEDEPQHKLLNAKVLPLLRAVNEGEVIYEHPQVLPPEGLP